MERFTGRESMQKRSHASVEDPVCAEVIALELDLLRPEVRASRERLDRLLSDDFLEIGAGGRMFGKDEVLDRLPHETGIGFATEDMRARRVTAEIVLVVYGARRSADGVVSRSLRSSWWRRENGEWRMLFHQGTASPQTA